MQLVLQFSSGTLANTKVGAPKLRPLPSEQQTCQKHCQFSLKLKCCHTSSLPLPLPLYFCPRPRCSPTSERNPLRGYRSGSSTRTSWEPLGRAGRPRPPHSTH